MKTPRLKLWMDRNVVKYVIMHTELEANGQIMLWEKRPLHDACTYLYKHQNFILRTTKASTCIADLASRVLPSPVSMHPAMRFTLVWISLVPGLEKMFISREANPNFPENRPNFPSFLMYFFVWKSRISLQIPKFPGKELPKFHIFSRPVPPNIQIYQQRVSKFHIFLLCGCIPCGYREVLGR